MKPPAESFKDVDQKVEIAAIFFGYDNSDLINKLTERGTYIK